MPALCDSYVHGWVGVIQKRAQALAALCVPDTANAILRGGNEQVPRLVKAHCSDWIGMGGQQQQAAGGGAGAEASVGASVGASVPVVKPPMRRKDQEALLTLLCQKDARGRSAMDIAVSQETRGAFEVRPLWVCCGSVVQLEVEVSGE